ncbi:MAG: DUF1570 domain-containing protein [Planctomycetales bacterium]
MLESRSRRFREMDDLGGSRAMAVRNQFRNLIGGACLWSMLVPAALLAQDKPSAGSWVMDRVVLRSSGAVLEGLIQEETDDHVRILRCIKKPGRPLSFIGMKVRRGDVKHVSRLATEQRNELRRRIDSFKNRRCREQASQASLKLHLCDDLGPGTLCYRGKRFTLLTTTAEKPARLAVTRLEERFRAFMHYLPPRREPTKPLTIILWGSKDEYQAYKARVGLKAANSAFFDAQHNRVVSHTDLNRVLTTYQKTLDAHEARRREFLLQEQSLRAELQRENAILFQQNVNREERKLNGKTRMASFQKRRNTVLREIEELDRRNEARLKDDPSFRMLYHEAFHAYLENYVYERAHQRVPRWLNEGLAQAMEGASLEFGEKNLLFRSPDWEALTRKLAADLQGPQPMSLRRLLTAPNTAFLIPHGEPEGEQTAARHYLYAWGLADYLQHKLLRGRTGTARREKLDAYVNASAGADPVERFEKLFGQSLDDVEADWRNHVLNQAKRKPNAP